VIAPASGFPTYLWRYLVARLIHDHLGIVVIVVMVAGLLSQSSRR
jgi:hypothetical protein